MCEGGWMDEVGDGEDVFVDASLYPIADVGAEVVGAVDIGEDDDACDVEDVFEEGFVFDDICPVIAFGVGLE